MTRRLYYEDSHRKEFQAVVTACEKAENYWRVSLDQTAFFPEGGGQAGDSGFLEDVEIFDTHEKQGIVWHYAKAPLDPGAQVLGRIDLATFANSEGLMQSGNSYFTATSNSGDAELAIAGENGTGGLRNSALEMSNVDLSQEFSDMITTQRGFQACSRLITVSDTMLEELINLKR